VTWIYIIFRRGLPQAKQVISDASIERERALTEQPAQHGDFLGHYLTQFADTYLPER
jgi:hypothetical protein